MIMLCLERDTGGCGSRGDIGWSGSFRRPSDDSPKRLSREPPRPLVPGGGGKDVVAGGSGDGRWRLVGGIRAADVLAEAGSKAVLSGRWDALGGL